MHLDYQIDRYLVPGSAIRSGGGGGGGGGVGFLAEVGLVPAGELGRLQLGWRCCIALAADGNAVL